VGKRRRGKGGRTKEGREMERRETGEGRDGASIVTRELVRTPRREETESQ
jgi:hypothetical protein